MIKVSFITILLLISLIAISQGPGGGYDGSNMPNDGSVSGVIKEANTNIPVEYASIALYSAKDSSIVDGTIADNEGNFLLNKLSYGKYFVEINFIGYNKKRINKIFITPQKKDVNIGNITLNRSVTQIEEVEVSAEKTYIEYKIDKKIVNVSQDIVSAGETAVEVLENTPSVQTDIDGNVTLRGSSSFTVLIDGKPTIMEGSDALQQIPASQIENIEIITNPSAKYDPDGIAGIINVVLKKERESGITGLVNASVSHQGSYKGDLLINYRIGKLNLFVGGNYNLRNRPGNINMTRETYYDTITNFYTKNGERSRNRNGYNIKTGIEYNINDKNYISLTGSTGLWGMERIAYTNLEEYTSDDLNDHLYYVSDNVFDIAHYSYSLSPYYQHKFKQKGHELSVTGHYSTSNGTNAETLDEYITLNDWDIANINPAMQQTNETSTNIKTRIKADYIKPMGKNGKLESGLQTRFYNGTSDYSLSNYNDSSAAWVENLGQENTIDFTRTIHSAYSTFSNFFGGFEFLLGIRGEYTDRRITSEITQEEFIVNRYDFFPTVHLSRPITETQQVQASYSRRIRRPREWYLDPFINYADKRNIRTGNPALLPEYTDSYELNYQLKLKKSSFVSLETYYRQTNNKINRIQALQENDVMLHTFVNLDKDYAIGTELMANIAIFKWWNLNASFDFFNYHIDGEILEDEVSQVTNTWSSRFNTTFKLKWGTRLQINGFYNAPSITAQGERNGFFVTSVAVKQDFMKRKLSLSFQVKDVFQTMKHSFSSYNDSYYSFMEFTNESPVFTLSISYKINNYKRKTKERGGEEIDFDGGDDM